MGYILTDQDGRDTVIEDDEQDELKHMSIFYAHNGIFLIVEDRNMILNGLRVVRQKQKN